MAGEQKINLQEQAQARLADLSVEELRARRQGDELKDLGPNDEDWSPKKEREKSAEEGWQHAGTQKGSKFSRKKQSVKSSRKQTERREVDLLPTAEQCEALREHQHYQWFLEGAWTTYLKETQNVGLTSQEQKEEFDSICAEYFQDYIQGLVSRGNMPDWQEFSARNKKSEKDEVPAGTFYSGSVEVPVETGIQQELGKEAKDWREVKRSVEIDAVGDLHGSFEGFRENLKSLGLVTEAYGELQWTGGNRRTVLIGDILADRGMQGMDILLAIADLREQAEKQGGEIDILAGNHDDFFISFLMDKGIAGTGDAVENSRLSGQGMGLLELVKYGSSELQAMLGKALQFKGEGELSKWSKEDHEAWQDLLKINELSPVWDKLKQERAQILENMRGDAQGRKVLHVICSMKLAEKIDDTLFVHTNPANGMTRYLFKPNDIQRQIDYINDFYQRSMKAVLLEGRNAEEGFDGLRGLFLNTNNRNEYSDNQDEMEFIINDKFGVEQAAREEEIAARIGEIRKQGVNAIVHGHTDEYKPVKGVERFGFPIISIDTSAFKKNRYKDKRSILKIAKDGKIQRAEKMEYVREDK